MKTIQNKNLVMRFVSFKHTVPLSIRKAELCADAISVSRAVIQSWKK